NSFFVIFFFQAEDGIRDRNVTGVQTCALPILYWWQVGKFFRDDMVRNHFLPVLYEQFDAVPSARPAFFRLNEDLLPTVRSRSKRSEERRVGKECRSRMSTDH